jgi:alpha-L-fucosidase
LEEDRDVDFRTLGDNQLGTEKLDYPWQSPGTVAHSWGYHRNDTDWKSTTSLLKALINNVSLNGNYMLNIGPRSDGVVPYEIRNRMEEMGNWLEVNGEAIYGCSAYDLPSDQHDWGRITYKKIDHDTYRIYLHIYHWPYHRKLPVTGIVTAPQRVYALEDKLETELTFDHKGPYAEIILPALQPNPYVSVVVMEFDQVPQQQKGLTARTASGGYALNQTHARQLSGDFAVESKRKRGSVPEHVVVDQDLQASWEIYIPTAGPYRADVSYSMQHPQASGKLTLELAKQELHHPIQPTGVLVTEPNQNWHVDNFASHAVGEFNVAQPGTYQIHLNISSEEAPVRFQWIWITSTEDR